MESSHQTFTFDIRKPLEYSLQLHKEVVSLINETYDIEEYLVSFESHNSKNEAKPHFHVLVFTDYKNCTNLIPICQNPCNSLGH